MHELMYSIIDVETENTGSDVMKDNRRILSVQVGDAAEQELYYYDSQAPQYTLAMGRKRIASLLSQGYVLAGYNIRNFDVPILKQFLAIDISESNMFDLSRTPRVIELNKSKKFSLEDVCKECGIDADHKRKMEQKAEKHKQRQDIKDQAYAKANDDVKNKGWSFDFSYDRALKKLAVGNAILEAYHEFVESGGQRNTLFYEYAIGDIICEHRLLRALGY